MTFLETIKFVTLILSKGKGGLPLIASGGSLEFMLKVFKIISPTLPLPLPMKGGGNKE